MDLETIWKKFIEQLSSQEEMTASYQKMAGIPFLYVTVKKDDLTKKVIEERILKAAGKAMRGKQLHSETVFVRKEPPLYVYRHRFYVPQRKMFCCGNLCEDCIRLKPN